MKMNILLISLALFMGVQQTSAQFTLTLPKLPKERVDAKAKDTPRKETLSVAEHPTIIKDTVHATAYTLGNYRGDYDSWSWTPLIEFSVNGPIPSGGQLYAQFTLPGGQITFDCRTEAISHDRVWNTRCGGSQVPEQQSSLFTGPVSFAIRLRNELAGTDSSLFTGKIRVEKSLLNLAGPKAAKKFVYFVNHDWNLPIGYVFLTPNDVSGMKKPLFNVAFWIRGEYQGNFEPHLFYQGKEVGKVFLEGREVGKPTCDREATINPSQTVADTMPQKATWVRVRCRFFGVLGWDKSGDDTGLFGPLFELSKNQGEYEIKVLRANRLARSIKFTVATDGKFDNGVAAANELGRERVVVPVQIIGDQDGTWNRNAWRTDAFYGNPLAGFTAQ